MARTITEIKKEMTDIFMRDQYIRSKYQFEKNFPPLENPDDIYQFDECFSKVSIENILFSIVATAIWTLEVLFDRHKKEVTDYIDEMKPHSLRWYANKAKSFQMGCDLIDGWDEYDNTALTDKEIEDKKIVKFAAVVEKEGMIFIKVATETNGKRGPLDDTQLEALENYFMEIKDAGVNFEIINTPGNLFNIDIDIYYNPQLYDGNLNKLDGSGKVIHKAIETFVENLPFNGEYQNSALIEYLLKIEGVELVNLNGTYMDGQIINAREVPSSGYFKIPDIEQLTIKPVSYGNI